MKVPVKYHPRLYSMKFKNGQKRMLLAVEG